MASARPTTSSRDFFEEACLDRANKLIRLCDLPYPQVSSLQDINANLFIQLFERICGTDVPDLIAEPPTFEDEAHNVQAVIDALALDVLMISLSHITGEDVVSGSTIAMYNLLEILEAYMLYIPNEAKASILIPKEPQLAVSESGADSSIAVCTTCGYGLTSDALQQASIAPVKGPVHCPVCKNSLHRKADVSKSELAKTELGHHKKRSRNLLMLESDELEEGTLSGSSGSDVCMPQPTVVEDGKLKPEFARVGLRDLQRADEMDAEATSSRRLIPHVSFMDKENAAIAADDDVRVLDLSSTLTTALFNGEPVRKRSDIGRKSRSLDDISNRVKLRRDRVTQTSQSLLPGVGEQPQYAGARPKARPVEEPKPTAPQEEEDLAEIYAQNLAKRVAAQVDKRTQRKAHDFRMKRAYINSLKRPCRKPVKPICRKSFLLPHDLRRRSPSQTSPKRVIHRAQYPVSQRVGKRKASLGNDDQNLLEEVLEEFPGVQMPPGVVRNMSDKYERHLQTLRKNIKDSLARKSQTQIQTEEAIKRQKILSDIFMKEIQHNVHMNDLKEHQELTRKVKASNRNTRMESARQKQYSDEFYDQLRRRLQKQNYREEQLLKNVFHDGLQMQRSQVNQLREQFKEKEQKDAKHHQIYIEALENFYQTQYNLLINSLATEKRDIDLRAKAQQRVLNTMKREYRTKMENEIRNMQEQIVQNTEDTHFREMDAENLRETLRDKFSAHPLWKI